MVESGTSNQSNNQDDMADPETPKTVNINLVLTAIILSIIAAQCLLFLIFVQRGCITVRKSGAKDIEQGVCLQCSEAARRKDATTSRSSTRRRPQPPPPPPPRGSIAPLATPTQLYVIPRPALIPPMIIDGQGHFPPQQGEVSPNLRVDTRSVYKTNVASTGPEACSTEFQSRKGVAQERFPIAIKSPTLARRKESSSDAGESVEEHLNSEERPIVSQASISSSTRSIPIIINVQPAPPREEISLQDFNASTLVIPPKRSSTMPTTTDDDENLGIYRPRGQIYEQRAFAKSLTGIEKTE
ncbi:hypothetical protein H072_10372 [Dactylellina haptotyla CBS 200.50]|uniref:Uncharacterized protein n=1 Tax=Dactylellina haptotyla (strain CBS 200.50) TaxID=1284197 RepID=S8BAH2_DACHA|nr:hypothetical protein H072_10372 [Dactylellina haptotyla CBS 200.50]